MPRLNQLRNPNLDDWQLVPPTPTRPAETTPSAPANPEVNLQPLPSRSPMMRAPMPIAASTADAFARQFYGGPNVPSWRILPAKRSDTL
jgi:hypothetical protein